MPIDRGPYLITSKIEGGAGVGTQLLEGDTSKVVILPKGVQPPVVSSLLLIDTEEIFDYPSLIVGSYSAVCWRLRSAGSRPVRCQR